MSELLLEILSVSLMMTVLIFFLWLLFRWLGGRFTAKCRYIVWTLVFVRLCLPVGIFDFPPLVQVCLTAKTETDIPTETIVPEETTVKPAEIEVFVQSTEPEPTESTVWEVEPEIFEAPPAPVTENLPTLPTDTDREPSLLEKRPTPTPKPSSTDETAPFPRLTILGIVWLAGALLYLTVHLISYNRYTRHIQRTCRDVPANILRIHRHLCKRYGIRRVPDLKISPRVHSPLLCGYFRPCVFLPDVTLSPGQAVSVLAHELTHRRRNDVWFKFACVLGCALHWFNPAVFLAAAQCCDEMELSCDESVLAGMDEETRRSYGKVMLDLVRYGRDRSTVLTTRFHPKKRAVRERFLNIMDMSKKKRGLAVILTAAALCTLAGMVFAYDAEPPADGENIIKINDNVSIRIGFGGLRPLLPPKMEEDPAEAGENIEDAPYEFDGITFTLPADVANLTDVTKSSWTGGLFDVYHKATVENGAPGWLYSVCRHTYDELVRDDVNHGGIRYFAATPDNTAFYYLLSPTDVQFDPSDKETSAEYERLSEEWKTLINDVIEENGLVPFDSSDIPGIVHLTADQTVYPSYAPAIYPVRLEHDETYGWLLRGDGAGPNGMALGDALKDADIYAEWVTETCCRMAVDGEVYDLYRKDAVWAFEKSDFGFAWENNLPVWTISDFLSAANESSLLHRIAYERMSTDEFLSLPTIQSALLREVTALVKPYRPESPDTATVHGDPYYVPDGVVFPETIEFQHLQVERNNREPQEWTVWFKAGEMSVQTTATVQWEKGAYRLALTDPEFHLLNTIHAEEGDLRPLLESLATDPRTDYVVEVLVDGTKNARLTLEVSGEGRDLHQIKTIALRSMKAMGRTMTFEKPWNLWTSAAVHVFGVDNAVVLDQLSTEYTGKTFLFTSRDIYEYNPREYFSLVLYEENNRLRYRHSSNLLNPQAENILGNATARDNFSYECGDVRISGGQPQFYVADEYYTIDDVFDLDVDFATYWKSEAFPTLDHLLLYNAERYRDMNDYPTPDETPLPAEVFHDDATDDKAMSNEETLARLTDGTMTMQDLLDSLNEQNIRYILNGSTEPYTMDDVYGILPSLWNDGGIDVLLPLADTGYNVPTDDDMTTKLHYVPGETYPTYTVEEGFTATYRLIRRYDAYYILVNIVDTRDLPVPEEKQGERRVLNPDIPEDYTFTFNSDDLSVNSVGAILTYTNDRGQLYERPIAFSGNHRTAEWYFENYLEGTYDMDTLMNHTKSVPLRVWSEVKETLDAYRNGELPYDGAPAFPKNCTVPTLRLTEEILKLHQNSGVKDYPFKVEFTLENGQTMRILWTITRLGKTCEITQKVVFLA